MSLYLEIEQARQHNLRIPSLRVPMHSLVGVTGPSGSGKSSLVVHTILAESQRRYLSSLSTYQRQFFERWEKPDVEAIHNLGASLFIGQKNQIRNARATVATTSGLYGLLAALYARCGIRYCEACDTEVRVWTPESAHAYIHAITDTVWLGFPFVFSKEPAIFKDEVALFLKQGLDEICEPGRGCRQNGERTVSLIDPAVLKEVVGREVLFVLTRDRGAAITLEAMQEVFRVISAWSPILVVISSARRSDTRLAIQEVCPQCGLQYGQLMPDHFSFYSSMGACPDCHGFGVHRVVDLMALSTRMDHNQSIADGFFSFLGARRFSGYYARYLKMCEKHGVPIHIPWRDLSASQRQAALMGTGSWTALEGLFSRLEAKKYKMSVRVFLNTLYSEKMCDTCGGGRLVKKALKVTMDGLTLPGLTALTIDEAATWLEAARRRVAVPDDMMDPLKERLAMLQTMGVGYLPLDRPSKSLSGGEVQRLSIVHHLGTQLSDMLYVMDEPSIGLHPKDCENLIAVARRLIDQGNHAMIIEHDRGILARLDHMIEMGPGSGQAGGCVVWQGTRSAWTRRQGAKKWLKNIYKNYQPSFERWLTISGAAGHNLKNISTQIPLQCLVGVCGISGSGKTSLIIQSLVPYLEKQFGRQSDAPPLPVETVEFQPRYLSGIDFISQSLPTRSSRANLLTFTRAFDLIRRHMAASDDARRRRMKAGHFSFNTELGQCPTCQGAGEVVMEMVFMEDLRIRCDDCRGRRYRDEVLKVYFKGKNIADVLDMTVDEAIEFFAFDKKLRALFSVIKSVGLGYMRCGQGVDTYSGGELQRLKIARIFLSPVRRPMLYVLDEPTTGLHEGEIRQLLFLFHRMVSEGHTVIVIEHQTDVLAACDYLIELGPGGGEAGGRIVFEGPTAGIRDADTPTAPYIRASHT